ncbi:MULTISPECIES: N-acetylmuramoyl-L-alanine amidase [Helicobacter]|uniref:N-acetylmuramoyl-L-alanine amidase n=3 Tax=Helicobacter TaxID=209 RepID=A0A3D8IFT2_9HELI|nr:MULTISPECIES: N-acetylmuramoyl-L-alanine amidase [Helicobacter]RDU63855.1 N-acetylmuramoyl-L-alanine amidase [Helicobacter ganmani]
MIRFFLLFCLFCSGLLAEVKILSVQQLQNGIVLNFNQIIKPTDFKNFLLQSQEKLRYVYDIESQLQGSARVFEFQGDVRVKVAQNSQEKVRLVITSSEQLKIELKINKKQATFTIPNAKLAQSNFSIASLFEPQIPANQSKEIQKKQTPVKTESSKSSPKKQEKTTPKTAHTTKSYSNKINKTIVIDPGHGGKDCGAMGVDRVCEKKIVLNIGKYLRDELKKRGYKTYMTRDKDVFIGLRQRTNFANNKNADLFISIHANAISENKAKFEGVESYFLSTARSERAKKVAALENKDDTEGMNYFSKQSFLNTLNTQRIVASNRLAIDIQYGMLQSLRPKYATLDGGVREGPFWVLVGAIMPSVLLEVGYITHPKEGKRLNQTAFQKTIAKGIADGVDGYFQKNP